ncbi:MAG: hypothetical protein COS97_01925 [Candidatus Nealsonbacteria bacterium CG07_land_8_20_14_0_80_40_10]|nr:MAG: hypothetical protein COS97_01925 [Candidatus Nealsonbacteria bacterium CG07_land_8_20_14_0_80_40_10]
MKYISKVLIYIIAFTLLWPNGLFLKPSSALAQEQQNQTEGNFTPEEQKAIDETDAREPELPPDEIARRKLINEFYELRNYLGEKTIEFEQMDKKKIKLTPYDDRELQKYLLVWRAMHDGINDEKEMDYYKQYNKGHKQPFIDFLLSLNPPIDALKPYDIRIIKLLNYLVKPVDLGGAGHEFIKARIRSGYKNEKEQLSKESDFPPEEPPNISAHFDGQAVDISQADYLKCTLLKRRRAASTIRRRQPLKPIQVAWQSDQGLAGVAPFGDNFNEVAQNMVLAEFGNIFTPEGKLRGDAWKTILFELGKYRLAEELEIDEVYIEDSTPKTFYHDIGYALLAKDLETNLQRPPCGDYSNVLSGDINDIYRRLALNELEDELELPRGGIGLNPVQTANDINDFYKILKNIGKRRLEKDLDLPACHFDQASIDWNLVEQKLNEKREIYQNVDQALGLPTREDGATDSSSLRLRQRNEKVFYVIGAAALLSSLNYEKDEKMEVLRAVEAGDAEIKISFKNRDARLEISTDDLEKIFQKSDSLNQVEEDAYVTAQVNEQKELCLQLGELADVDCNSPVVQQQWANFAHEEYRQLNAGAGERSRKTVLERLGQTLWEKYTTKNIKKIRGPLREAIIDLLGKNPNSNVVNLSDLYSIINGRKLDDMLLLAGVKLMENSLDLPKNSLKYFFIRDKNQVWAGEQMNSDKFLQDVGEARVDELVAELNVRDFAAAMAQLGTAAVDKKLYLDSGTTNRFLTAGITAEDYFKEVGSRHLANVGATSIMGLFDFNPRIGTYWLTQEDAINLFLGRWDEVMLKIGSKWAEDKLETPEGFIYNIASAPNQLDALNNAIFAAGGQSIARAFGLAYLDIRGINSTGDFTLRLGQEKVEETLALKRGSFKNNLQYIQEQNGVEKLARAFGWLPTGTNAKGDFAYAYGLEKATQWRQTHNDQPASDEQIAGWAIDGGDLYDELKTNQAQRWQYVDRLLVLTAGDRNTEKLTKGEMTVENYTKAVGNHLVASDYLSTLDIDDILGLDSEYEITGGQLYAALQSGDWKPIIANAAGYTIDNILKIEKGTFQDWYTETDPVQREKILITAGAKKLAKAMGIEYNGTFELLVNVYLAGHNADVIAFPDRRTWRALAVDEIKAKTHIPDTPNDLDAYAFVDGRLKDALIFWGLANFIYEEDENGQVRYRYRDAEGNPIVNYEEIRTAIYGDRDYYTNSNSPERQYTLNQSMDFVSARRDELYNQCLAEHNNDASACTQNFAEQATNEWQANQLVFTERSRAEYRRQQLRNVSYKIIDWQLQKIDEAIPNGFAQRMLEGTGQERVELLMQYLQNVALNTALKQLLGLSEDNALAITHALEDNGKIDEDELASLTGVFTWLDSKWEGWFGFTPLAHTSEAIFKFAAVGFDLNSPAFQDLKGIYEDWATNRVYGWFDKKWNLKPGTAKLIYDSYVNYYKAYKAYQGAKAAGDAASITQAAQNLKAVQANVLAAVITFVFAKQLAWADQKLGLVPGTSAMLVGYLLAPSPITLALIIVLNLFGVYRVEMYCSVAGYPKHGGEYLDDQKVEAKRLEDAGAPGIFNALNTEEYKEGLKKAAQWKVRNLLENILNTSDKLGENMRPTQIMTLRQEDVDYFQDKLNQLFGQFKDRWRTGLWANQKVFQYVHIGY